ncbi:MAG: exodeoxyribonuclease VII large subunit [Bacteroidetes bacterium]|nr:exodeoxyribonuclease VII large subunit [Bacteroidota bacterium]
MMRMPLKYQQAQGSAADGTLHSSILRYFNAAMAEQKVYSLEQLNRSIGKAISDRTGGAVYWIRAEIAQWNVHSSGHVYLDLAEERNGQLVAKAQAVVWKNDYIRIVEALGGEAAQVLRRGSEIQCAVAVSYHPVHGLKLVLREVDLEFALGQQEKRKQETLVFLKESGLLRKNAAVPMPPVVQRLALVGAPDSAGVADFVRHLLRNEYGYRFGITLFPVKVQGEGAASEIATALQNIEINTVKERFDAVVLVRGGGSRLDLDVFNDRALAVAIAEMALPLITGIGHETDRSVADEVAHTMAKTPTAVAAFLLDRAANFEMDQRERMERIRFLAVRELKTQRGRLSVAQEGFQIRAISSTQRRRGDLHQVGNRIARALRRELADRQSRLQVSQSRIRQSPIQLLRKEAPAVLAGQSHQLQSLSKQMLRSESLQLERHKRLNWLALLPIRQAEPGLSKAEGALRLLDPDTTLARGYAIVRYQGKAIAPTDLPAVGAELAITLFAQKLTARVEAVEARKAPGQGENYAAAHP